MTKKEVEMNEEGIFKKWLAGCDGVVEDWREEGEERDQARREREKRRERGEQVAGDDQKDIDEAGFDWPRSTSESTASREASFYDASKLTSAPLSTISPS